MKLSNITISTLQNKYILKTEQYEEVLNLIHNSKDINKIANQIAIKYKDLMEFQLDKDFEKTVMGVFAELDTIRYIVSVEIALSNECIILIKEELSNKKEYSRGIALNFNQQLVEVQEYFIKICTEDEHNLNLDGFFGRTISSINTNGLYRTAIIYNLDRAVLEKIKFMT